MIVARILGTSSGMPDLERSHSALWCKVNEQNVLFDCGEGTAKKLIKYGLDNNVLDAVILSHLHPDHATGIFMVIQMLYLQQRTKPLKIFLPERAGSFKEIFDLFYLFPARLSFPIEFKKVSDLPEEIPDIKPLMNAHLKSYQEYIEEHDHPNLMNCYSFLINTGITNILFTSDINRTSHLIKYLDESGILIIDALHPPIEEMMNVLNRKRNNIILVHGISREMREVINNDNGLQAVIADDGYPIDV